MSTALSAKLPKIDLYNSMGSLQFTIPLNYKHFANGGTLDFGWPKEYANDFIAANNTRSRKKRFNGYRFYMNISVTDKFLKAGVSNGYEQELFEKYMNDISIYEVSYGFTIRIYPWNDKTYYYNCTVDSFVKTTGQDDGQLKTCWHNYQISLTALDLVTTKPTPSY